MQTLGGRLVSRTQTNDERIGTMATHASPKDFVLWGVHPLYAGGVPIRIEAGAFRTCRGEMSRRKADGGWTTLVVLAKCERMGGLPYGHDEHVCAS